MAVTRKTVDRFSGMNLFLVLRILPLYFDVNELSLECLQIMFCFSIIFLLILFEVVLSLQWRVERYVSSVVNIIVHL